MQLTLRSFILPGLILICSAHASAQTEKERELASNAMAHTDNTINLLDSLIEFSIDFLKSNKGKAQPDFAELNSKMKFMDKHIKNGVKIASKLQKKMAKREGTFTEKEFRAYEEIYLYERGQVDFYECYESTSEAKYPEYFEDGMSGLINKLMKTEYYIKEYHRILSNLLAKD